MTIHSTAQNNVNLPKVTETNQADESKLAFILFRRIKKVTRVTNGCDLAGEVVLIKNIFYPRIVLHTYWDKSHAIWQLVKDVLLRGPFTSTCGILYKQFFSLMATLHSLGTSMY